MSDNLPAAAGRLTTPRPEAYLRYRDNQQRLDRFHGLAELSIKFTAHAVSELSAEELKNVRLPSPDLRSRSSAFGDRRVQRVELKRGWITFEEYARETGSELSDVEGPARAGALGPVTVNPATGASMLFWPPKEHSKSTTELPPVGPKKTYRVVIEEKCQVSLHIEGDGDTVRQAFLSLAHSHGDPEEASETALELLRQVCFLQEWLFFEIFLRETVHDLLRRHPRKLAAVSRGKRGALTAEEIVEMSNNLSSIEVLTERLVQREIDRQQADGQSVHGLINFLKSEFRFADDPYCAPYVLQGVLTEAHYEDLMELKDVRNSMAHDGGIPPESFFHERPTVPKSQGRIAITDDYYLKASLTLRSIGHCIADSIACGRYQPE